MNATAPKTHSSKSKKNQISKKGEDKFISRIIENLDKVKAQDWELYTTYKFQAPKNLFSQNTYKGFNLLTLYIDTLTNGFTSSLYATFNSISKAGGKLEPSWNKKSLFFKMDKAVLKHLLNMTQYYSIKKDLSFNTSTHNTLRFLMWIVKFKKLGGITKEYSQLLKELSIPVNKYEGYYRFERDFLIRVKADLDKFNDISFNYSYKEGL